MKIGNTGTVVKEEVLANPVLGEVRASQTGFATPLFRDDDGRNQKLHRGF
jgi:hypothetical protein